MAARRVTITIEGLARPLYGVLTDSAAEADALVASGLLAADAHCTGARRGAAARPRSPDEHTLPHRRGHGNIARTDARPLCMRGSVQSAANLSRKKPRWA